jgi:hypothetical protein
VLPPNPGGFGPNLAAFLGLPVVSPDGFEAIADEYDSQTPGQYLAADTHPTVLAGYAAQKALYSAGLRNKTFTINQQMILGFPGGSVQNLHPVSRGSVKINATNPEGPPIVDYRAMSNPVDTAMMVENVKFMRRYMTTGMLAEYQAIELTPGPAVATDEQIADWVRQNTIPSVFHPVGTAAKMPRHLGGVVREDLLVHGVKKLSVVDGSIMPTLVGGTTQMSVYAIAEKVS